METEGNPILLSRRFVLALAAGGLVARGLRASPSEFWNKKDPSQWTSEEIDQLTSKSPWAKEVTAQFAAGEEDGSRRGGQTGGGYPGGGGGGGGSVGMPRIGIGGIGIGLPGGRGRGGGGRNGGGGGRGRGGASNYKGTVRWESAQPIFDALKNPLPDAFAKHYVIRVSGFPLLNDRRRSDDDDSVSTTPSKANKDMLDNLKHLTTLQPKGKALAEPAIVQQPASTGTVFLFGFSKDLFDFGKNDHEVDFSTQLGRLMIKAKFDPKEMMYHGKLAV